MTKEKPKRELKSAPLVLRLKPTVKAIAKAGAERDGRNLTNYLERLVLADRRSTRPYDRTMEPSQDEVKAALQKVSKSRALKILQYYGAADVGGLPPRNYRDVFEACGGKLS